MDFEDFEDFEPVLGKVLISCFLFIEFPPTLMKNEKCVLGDSNQVSSVQTKSCIAIHNNHFTSAVKDHNTCVWTYFDDLSVNLLEFSNFRSLRQVYSEGWFFNPM